MALRIWVSFFNSAISQRPAISDVTKVLVAATLNSGPAWIGKVAALALARGDVASLVIATVKAPVSARLSVIRTMSGLCPDCETDRHSMSLA